MHFKNLFNEKINSLNKTSIPVIILNMIYSNFEHDLQIKSEGFNLLCYTDIKIVKDKNE